MSEIVAKQLLITENRNGEFYVEILYRDKERKRILDRGTLEEAIHVITNEFKEIESDNLTGLKGETK